MLDRFRWPSKQPVTARHFGSARFRLKQKIDATSLQHRTLIETFSKKNLST
ncbi:hypothetical protein SynA1560_02013 [Synechococcus sp. A15-60]|nr:hypothetical protein SynA1560_02013 [Synechococcus sp. A15-60]